MRDMERKIWVIFVLLVGSALSAPPPHHKIQRRVRPRINSEKETLNSKTSERPVTLSTEKSEIVETAIQNETTKTDEVSDKIFADPRDRNDVPLLKYDPASSAVYEPPIPIATKEQKSDFVREKADDAVKGTEAPFLSSSLPEEKLPTTEEAKLKSVSSSEDVHVTEILPITTKSGEELSSSDNGEVTSSSEEIEYQHQTADENSSTKEEEHRTTAFVFTTPQEITNFTLTNKLEVYSKELLQAEPHERNETVKDSVEIGDEEILYTTSSASKFPDETQEKSTSVSSAESEEIKEIPIKSDNLSHNIPVLEREDSEQDGSSPSDENPYSEEGSDQSDQPVEKEDSAPDEGSIDTTSSTASTKESSDLFFFKDEIFSENSKNASKVHLGVAETTLKDIHKSTSQPNVDFSSEDSTTTIEKVFVTSTSPTLLIHKHDTTILSEAKEHDIQVTPLQIEKLEVHSEAVSSAITTERSTDPVSVTEKFQDQDTPSVADEKPYFSSETNLTLEKSKISTQIAPLEVTGEPHKEGLFGEQNDSPQDISEIASDSREESSEDISDSIPHKSGISRNGASSNEISTEEDVEYIRTSKHVTEESSSEEISTKSVTKPSVQGFGSKTSTKEKYISGKNKDLVAAVQFLHYHDKASSEQCFKLVNAHWNYATNLTEENKHKQLAQTMEYSMFHKEAWRNATSFAWKSFNDTVLRRWFKSLSVLGTAVLSEDKLSEFNRIKAEMKNVYSTAKVCNFDSKESLKEYTENSKGNCSMALEPELQRVLTKSRDYDELEYVWKSWRDVAGAPIKEKYLKYIELSNEAAKLNGFEDAGEMWRESYESESFQEDLNILWEQLRPLYEHLHAYVRRKLIQKYSTDKIKEDGPIPAHLFGNMWAQSWVSLMDIVQPFPGKPSVDVTPTMEAKKMTILEMFKLSEEFFTSLGLKPMPEKFWKYSLIEKPSDREVICHASAWDFCNGEDYRIKQCTDITMEDLITVHHEMGHIQYFLQYARQPNVFREGANPGFHEAIGDVLALSVSTPKHLQSIGLLEEVAEDDEGDLNFLMRAALEKVAFLPSGYLIDLWRWGVFSGSINKEEMNTKWWELRLKYQGICPPVKRTETDFDPGAKYHVPGNVPYIRYFVSSVVQFQFHKILCDASGHTGPLYKCDIYRSQEAGQILSQVMELGSSEHWSNVMNIMTGGATNKMDALPILEYFEPLLKFLIEQNRNETIGWKNADPTVCP